MVLYELQCFYMICVRFCMMFTYTSCWERDADMLAKAAGASPAALATMSALSKSMICENLYKIIYLDNPDLLAEAAGDTPAALARMCVNNVQ